MNYLAHLHLSNPEPDAWIGNLMGDFVKGPIPDSLAPGIKQGVKLHRAVDQYTDKHPIFLRSKRRISPAYRRYAGILIDMFYDHYLALSWSHYSEQYLHHFAREVYTVLRNKQAQLPPRMQGSVSYMLANDLLNTYQQPATIAQSLRGIERRLKRPSRLGEAISELYANYSEFENDFHDFFPQIRNYTVEYKKFL